MHVKKNIVSIYYQTKKKQSIINDEITFNYKCKREKKQLKDQSKGQSKDIPTISH